MANMIGFVKQRRLSKDKFIVFTINRKIFNRKRWKRQKRYSINKFLSLSFSSSNVKLAFSNNQNSIDLILAFFNFTGKNFLKQSIDTWLLAKTVKTKLPKRCYESVHKRTGTASHCQRPYAQHRNLLD